MNLKFNEEKFVLLPVQRAFAFTKIFRDKLAEAGLLLGRDYTIAGGFVRFCISPKPNPFRAVDVDVFPLYSGATERMNGALRRVGLEQRHENEVSITFNKFEAFGKDCPPIQLIKPVIAGKTVTFGSIEEIVDNFDFTVTRCAMWNEEQALADVDFEADENKNRLRLKNIHCPVSSLLRVIKYGKKGYTMRPFEAMKLFADWDGRDDTYRERILDLFTRSSVPATADEPDEQAKLTQEELDELEALLRID